MDAVKFIEERNRMRMSFSSGCTGCPASNDLCCEFDNGSTLDATGQIAIVEEWSAAHPRKTRQSVFLERYPEAVVDESGVLMICPRHIYEELIDTQGMCKNPRKHCVDCCHEFWMQEV